MAAFDHISTKLCGRVESSLYNEKEQKVLQEKRKEEEKKSAEHKQKETSQAIQIADYEIKLQELITGYDKLQSDFNIAEKKIESLKVRNYFILFHLFCFTKITKIRLLLECYDCLHHCCVILSLSKALLFHCLIILISQLYILLILFNVSDCFK